MRISEKYCSWAGRAAALLLFIFPHGLDAQGTEGVWPPWERGERRVYQLLWPSGVSLGEAVLEASSDGEEIHLQATVEAKLPQHDVHYVFSAVATQELCSLRFQQQISEGSRAWEESFEFDPVTRQVRRTRNGQSSVTTVPECPRDPLTFLYYFRGQLASGKTPGMEELFLGTTIPLRSEAVAPETVKLGSREWEGDRFLVTYTPPGGEKFFEVWVHPGSARVPVGAKVPLALAIFAAELQ